MKAGEQLRIVINRAVKVKESYFITLIVCTYFITLTVCTYFLSH